jgi:hypothetical protein
LEPKERRDNKVLLEHREPKANKGQSEHKGLKAL